ncbi:MAG: hypothetical protein IPL61_05775 [Myxococcales bacterium]|nr:hypothetical protein [Myxococcales bacterium]
MSIWWWAFGYFACYVPYSLGSKLLSKPLIDTGATPVASLELLPPSVMAAVATLIVFLLATGWWRKAGRRTIAGVTLPSPGRLTALSGLCSSGIIATTTLAYTFSNVSIVFVALLMRGGVLVLAPIVDRVTKRKVRWFSWIALALSLASLVAAFASSGDARMPILAVVDVALYLGCYFTRLTLMSRKAKSADPDTNLRYFVEEGMVSAPALLVVLVIATLTIGGTHGAELRAGFTTFFERPNWWLGIAVGVLSQGTGIFGGLIFLDQRENAFCVPVNRVSSVLAVLGASLWLAKGYGAHWPNTEEWYGALLIIAAIGFLTIPPALEKRRKAAAAAALPQAQLR